MLESVIGEQMLRKGLTENHLVPEAARRASAPAAHPEAHGEELMSGLTLDDFLGPEISLANS